MAYQTDMLMHLQAITDGEEIDDKPYNRLLINVPPGMMKSLLVNVFWPAWEWGPKGQPNLRYLLVSHKIDLPILNAGKLRRLISSEWYHKRWPIKFRDDQNAKTRFEKRPYWACSCCGCGRNYRPVW